MHLHDRCFNVEGGGEAVQAVQRQLLRVLLRACAPERATEEAFLRTSRCNVPRLRGASTGWGGGVCAKMIPYFSDLFNSAVFRSPVDLLLIGLRYDESNCTRLRDFQTCTASSNLFCQKETDLFSSLESNQQYG